MKILHVCGWHEGGGWGAANRINAALQKYGVDSSMSPLGITPHRNSQGKVSVTDRIRSAIWDALSSSTNCSTKKLGIFGGTDAVEAINASDADIIHLHAPEYLIPIQHLPKVKKRIVWTLHDSRTFTGVWQYQNILEHDLRYAEGYSAKNKPQTSHGIDIDRWIWLWKKHCWKDLHATFTAPSRWEAGCFEESALFRGQRCHVIPNCIDTTVFYPHEQIECRKRLGLPLDKKLILFGAMNASAKIKGGEYLLKALHIFAKQCNAADYHLVIFGPVWEKDVLQDFAIPFSLTGRIDSEEKMAQLYSACNVFVCPSIIDNLPNTCIEAVNCGTPVAAFHIGGIPEIVQHRKTGYLASPYDVKDLADGIQFCLTSGIKSNKGFCGLERFSEQYVVERFLQIYEDKSV